MRLDRAAGHLKLFCNVGVVAALEQQLHNLPFPRSQTYRSFYHANFPLIVAALCVDGRNRDRNPPRWRLNGTPTRRNPTPFLRKSVALTVPCEAPMTQEQHKISTDEDRQRQPSSEPCPAHSVQSSRTGPSGRKSAPDKAFGRPRACQPCGPLLPRLGKTRGSISSLLVHSSQGATYMWLRGCQNGKRLRYLP
jgi:hypothetical protein